MLRRNFLAGVAALAVTPALASNEIHIEAAQDEDITNKLQHAFNSGAHRIVLPYGRFYLSSTVTPRRGQILEGRGSTTLPNNVWNTAKTMLVWDGGFQGVMFGLTNSRGFLARDFAVAGNGLWPTVFFAHKNYVSNRISNMTFENLFLFEVSQGWRMEASSWGCYWNRCIVHTFEKCAWRLTGRNSYSSFLRCEALMADHWSTRDVIIGEKDHSSTISFTACRFETPRMKRRYGLDIRNVMALSFTGCHFEMRVKKAYMYLKNVNGTAFANTVANPLSRGCCLYQQGNG